MKLEERKLPLSFGPRLLSQGCGGREGDVISWSRQFWIDQKFVRNLVVSTSEVFVAVQKECQKYYPDPVPQRVVTSLSRMYRGFIIEMCQNLKQEGNLEEAELYSNLEFVWNFCEIMFLSSNPDFPILPYLVEWIKMNFDMTEDILPKIVTIDEQLSEGEVTQLWNLIFSHVFHGATQEAANLLDYLKQAQDNRRLQRHVELMAELLLKRPIYTPEYPSVTEYEDVFQMWQEECLNRLENGAFAGADNFVFICKILCGDDEAFEEAVGKKLLTWYEYLVLTLNYKCPTVRPQFLKDYAVKTLDKFGLMEKLDVRDMIFLHAMNINIFDALREIQGVWDNPWFSLHFADLVFACGRNMEQENVDYSMLQPLRNFLLMEYGCNLMEHPTLWQLGTLYLEALPGTHGKSVIRECIQRRNPENELEAQKLIQIAEKYGFGDEIRGICRQLCLSKLKYGGHEQQQNALLWAIKAGDGTLTTRIVDSILFDGECEIESSLLDSLRNVLPCSNSLQFLHDFCSFRKMVANKDYRKAVDCLCDLVRRDLIPKRLAHKILMKNLSLFDNGANFSSDPRNILTLMEFVHLRIPKEQITPEDFTLLNQKLIRVRAYQVVHSFNKGNNNNSNHKSQKRNQNYPQNALQQESTLMDYD